MTHHLRQRYDRKKEVLYETGEDVMLMTRRRAVIGAATTGLALLLTGRQASTRLFEGVPFGQAPGDEGYKHELYHDEYQKVFGDRCGCRHGECRVTDWRKTQLDSPVGYDVIAYREWVPLRQDVWMPDLTQVSSELRREWAHICAYPPHTDHHMGDIRVTVPCAIINTRVRSRLVGQRTAVINQIRGFLLERTRCQTRVRNSPHNRHQLVQKFQNPKWLAVLTCGH